MQENPGAEKRRFGAADHKLTAPDQACCIPERTHIKKHGTKPRWISCRHSSGA